MNLVRIASGSSCGAITPARVVSGPGGSGAATPARVVSGSGGGGAGASKIQSAMTAIPYSTPPHSRASCPKHAPQHQISSPSGTKVLPKPPRKPKAASQAKGRKVDEQVALLNPHDRFIINHIVLSEKRKADLRLPGRTAKGEQKKKLAIEY